MCGGQIIDIDLIGVYALAMNCTPTDAYQNYGASISQYTSVMQCGQEIQASNKYKYVVVLLQKVLLVTVFLNVL